MKKVRDGNLNTVDYWENVYRKEMGSDKRRVDDARMSELIRWASVRHGELQRPVSLIDVGCGLGEVSRAFKRQGAPPSAYTGIDISPSAVEFARKQGAAGDCHQVGSATAIPFPAESFDVSWCGETLEHLDDPDAGMRELARVTREEGFIVISAPYRGRNRSPEHCFEFEPEDVCRWGREWGELVFLDCRLLEGWLTMFAVIRRRLWGECS